MNVPSESMRLRLFVIQTRPHKSFDELVTGPRFDGFDHFGQWTGVPPSLLAWPCGARRCPCCPPLAPGWIRFAASPPFGQQRDVSTPPGCLRGQGLVDSTKRLEDSMRRRFLAPAINSGGFTQAIPVVSEVRNATSYTNVIGG